MDAKRRKRQAWQARRNRNRGRFPSAASSCLPRQEAIRIALAAHRIIGRMSPVYRIKTGSDLLQFFGEHAEEFGFIDLDFDMFADPAEDNRPAMLTLLAWHIEQAQLRQRPTMLDSRVEWLRRTAGLSKFDADILALGVRLKLFEPWSKFQEAVDNRSGYLRPQFAAQILGCSVARAREALRRTGPLVRTGLIEDQRDDDYTVSRLVTDLMRMRASDPTHLKEALLRSAPVSTLEWDDFEHLAERNIAADLVAAATKKREGVNILLHGAPGTGKSEFARALAERLNLTPVFIGEADDEGGEPTRAERLAHLSMVRALTPAGAPRMIVIDEADDLMISGFSDHRPMNSKLWLNQLVESSSTPTIWIVNRPSVLGQPVIRRMALAVAFELPPRAVRKRVAERHAVRAGVPLLDQEASRLASLKVSPAVAANALKVARLGGGGTDTAILAARSVQRAMGGTQRPERLHTVTFDPAISRTSLDLVGLTNRLATSPERRWSMLLSGPPGTGKSAYARYAAAACGLEVTEKKGSDLLDMYVGGTERAIARAFEEAADAGAMLILDEADSMLRERRSAHRGWEVSMVNEILAWMEQHPVPFIATTNLSEDLDRATSRRFLFKLEFEYLDEARAFKLFQRTFGAPAPATLAQLDELTPAEFDVVARRASLLDITNEAQLVAMLRDELEGRSDGRRKPLGFCVEDRRSRNPRPFEVSDQRSGS